MAGKNYSSYFRTGPLVKGQGDKSQIQEYITVFCKAVSNGSAWMRGKWDWTNSISSNKWSTEQQVYTGVRANRSLSRKRMLIRGMGPSVQLEFRSEDGKPFDIIGWTSLDTTDAKP